MSFQPLIKTFKQRNEHFDLTWSDLQSSLSQTLFNPKSRITGGVALSYSSSFALASSLSSLIFSEKVQKSRRIIAWKETNFTNVLVLSKY